MQFDLCDYDIKRRTVDRMQIAFGFLLLSIGGKLHTSPSHDVLFLSQGYKSNLKRSGNRIFDFLRSKERRLIIRSVVQ